MPDVPMIEIPPMIPNFGLNVRAANSFPPDRADYLLYLAGQAVFLQYCCQFSSNQAAGSGVDGWSSNFEAEAGKRHRSYSFTSPEQEGGGRGLPSL